MDPVSVAVRYIPASDQKMGSITIGKFVAILSSHPPGLVREKHTHEEIHLIMIRTGRMNYTIQGQVYEVGPGDVLVIPPGANHSSEVLGEETSNVMCVVLL